MSENGEGVENVEEELNNGEQETQQEAQQEQEQESDLTELGLDAQVANELNAMFEQGMMRRDELDQRAIDGLKGLTLESALAVLEELKGCNLQAVSNKSAYMCGIMKSLRQKLAAGIMLDSSQKRPGPDEAKLKEITDRTGYTLEVSSGQRKYGGPPPNYDGPAPGPGQEVFCGKLPNNIFEEVLIPLFEKCGTIWDLRLMMDPATGYNKTFCFVTFTNKEGAQQAVKQLDNYEIRPGKRIKVNISVAKVRLFVGNIPKQRSKDEIMAEFSKISEGLRDVIVYSNPDDPSKKNRGFAFLDYDSHKNAAAGKRKMEGGQVTAWNRQFIVSWAEPQEEPDEETMSKVKVLYVKNLKTSVTEDNLRKAFEPYGAIERVKKTKDYGFVHFENREDAVKAMEELNGTNLGDSVLEISLAKPPSKSKKPQQMAMGAGAGAGAWAGPTQRGRGGRGRGRGAVQSMGYGNTGYGAGYDAYGYDSYGYDDSYYGYDDYGSNYDYYGGDASYGYGGGYGAPAAGPPAGFARGRGAAGGAGRGGLGARGAARGAAARGAAFGAARGARGARGGVPAGRGAGRGAAGVKRKAPDAFQGGMMKKAAGADAWGGDWSAQPIAQQPLGDAQWYQDSWS